MSRAPRTSVVIPAFNAGWIIAEAIASALRQTAPPLEVLVVDDGSTDDIAARIAALPDDRVRLLRQENRGSAAARNAGIRAARGEVLALLDADDIWPEDKLETQLRLLDGPPPADLVTGATQVLNATAPPEASDRGFVARGDPWTAPLLGSALFRRSVFDTVGLFDEPLRGAGEDVDWFIRARELGVATAATDRVTLYYRLHGRNMTHGLDAVGRGLFAALKRSLDRRASEGRSQVPAPAPPKGDGA